MKKFTDKNIYMEGLTSANIIDNISLASTENPISGNIVPMYLSHTMHALDGTKESLDSLI